MTTVSSEDTEVASTVIARLGRSTCSTRGKRSKRYSAKEPGSISKAGSTSKEHTASSKGVPRLFAATTDHCRTTFVHTASAIAGVSRSPCDEVSSENPMSAAKVEVFVKTKAATSASGIVTCGCRSTSNIIENGSSIAASSKTTTKKVSRSEIKRSELPSSEAIDIANLAWTGLSTADYYIMCGTLDVGFISVMLWNLEPFPGRHFLFLLPIVPYRKYNAQSKSKLGRRSPKLNGNLNPPYSVKHGRGHIKTYLHFLP